MNRGQRSREPGRRGAARAERERETLRVRRYAQRCEREGRGAAAPAAPSQRAEREVPLYEAELVPGLEEFARAELRDLLRGRGLVRTGGQPGTLQFPFRGDARLFNALGTLTSVYRIQRFDVPRPRALLGEEHLQSLLRMIQSVIALHPEGSFRSFRIGAAGVGSSVFARLSDVLESRTGMAADPDEGDLLLRVRRATVPPAALGSTAASSATAFELLVRLTPRPLAARAWRVCNLPGALNATVARVMVGLTQPSPHDRFVNLTCGSGTLMIERLALGPARLLVGGDQDARALRCARANLAAAGAGARAHLVQWDACRLPLGDASVNVLCADLPFGMLMGSRRENERLYPGLLAEAARVAQPDAALVLITHAVALLERFLSPLRDQWAIERRFEVTIPFQSGVLRPHVLLVRRTRRRHG